jgi:hypothetical protein
MVLLYQELHVDLLSVGINFELMDEQLRRPHKEKEHIP